MRRIGRILISFVENYRRREMALQIATVRINKSTRFDQVMQRPRTCANRGDDMGEKAPSHPTGILAGFNDCSCVLSPRCVTLGALDTGRRSPLNCRLTEKLGALAAMPAPTVGSAMNGMSPTKSSASAVIPNAPAMRMDSFAIGFPRSTDPTTPAIDQAYEKPPS
jgi:hypothetical protein